ncbi:hypothetical protein PSEUDO8BK_40999 [Pseudomonas sp. 8BK]|nr:hypothetical protein PSEUDO8BK_40999 [Pseudomonas sp. 8BK]
MMCVRPDSASPAHTFGVGPVFLWLAIRGRHPTGRREAALKIVPDNFLLSACYQSALSGPRRYAALKRTPGHFYASNKLSGRAPRFRLATGLANVAGFALIELSVQVLHDSITERPAAWRDP